MPRNRDKVEYPSDCKDVDDNLSKDELVRRLKALARAFQEMGQDNNDKYAPLALHLASEFFMDHQSKDVRLLVACCIADIFRIFAPEAPYKDNEHLKEIFLFITKQLRGLDDIEGASFKRYFYLLENLAWVKSFNICLELEDNQEIFCTLFKLIFDIVSDKHQGKVRNFMLDLMAPLINEGDTVSQELLDIVMINIIEPHKSQFKEAYSLAKDLIRRTANAIEPYIQTFFNNALVLGKTSDSEMSGHIYHLIYELNQIAPTVLLSVLPQLEFKLKSNDEKERRSATRILAKMFSQQESDLAVQNPTLWISYLGRYNDIDMNVRTTCVQYSQHFLVNHPSLIRDIVEHMRQRSHDKEESVRHEVILAIVNAARKDLGYVNDDLLLIVKERTLDKSAKVRREALLGLGNIYKQYTIKENANQYDLEQLSWIRNKVMHAYYQQSIEDRLVVERIFNTCLIPYQLEPSERMKKMYELYGSLDDPAVKAFHELLKVQTNLRRLTRELLDLHSRDPSDDVLQQRLNKCFMIARTFPDPTRASESMKKLNGILKDDERIRKLLTALVAPDCTCKKAAVTVKEIIKKLGNPTQQNHLYTNTKTLLERIAPLIIDGDAVEALVKLVNESVNGLPTISEDVRNPIESGVKLLEGISGVFPGAFNTESIFEYLMGFLKHEDDVVGDTSLQIFTNTAKNLHKNHPNMYSSLLPVLQSLAKIGTPSQAKHAVKCIDAISPAKEAIFAQIFEHLTTKSLSFDSANYRTALVSLGHIARLCPEKIGSEMKSIVAKNIVKDLLMQDREPKGKSTESWCADHLVSEETQAKILAMKLMVRWLQGLKSDSSKSGTSSMRLLHTMVIHGGDLMENNKVSKAEMARLRLTAGCCILKIAQESAYSDCISPEHFQAVALLINDTCFQVRLQFSQKLQKGLLSLRLPLQYMAVFSLAANDPIKDRRVEVRKFIVQNIQRRREYTKQHAINSTAMMIQIMPDYVMPYTVHLLAHDPDLKTYDCIEALQNIKECLWFMMEPLTKDESYNYSFFRKMFECMKQTRDAQGVNADGKENEEMNKKLYAVCDIALGLLASKSTNITLKDHTAEPVLPSKLFTKPDKNKINSISYLPKELTFTPPRKKGVVTNILASPKTLFKNDAGKATKSDSKQTSAQNKAVSKKASVVKESTPKTVKDATNKKANETLKSLEPKTKGKNIKSPPAKNTIDKYLKKGNKASTKQMTKSSPVNISSSKKLKQTKLTSPGPSNRKGGSLKLSSESESPRISTASSQKSSTSEMSSPSPKKPSRKAPLRGTNVVSPPSTPKKIVNKKVEKQNITKKKESPKKVTSNASKSKNKKVVGSKNNVKKSPVKPTVGKLAKSAKRTVVAKATPRTSPRSSQKSSSSGKSSSPQKSPSTPLKSLSAKSTPLKLSSAKSTPLKLSSAKSTPLRPSSAKSTPLRPSSAKSTPLRSSSAKSTPVKSPIKLSLRSSPIKKTHTLANKSPMAANQSPRKRAAIVENSVSFPKKSRQASLKTAKEVARDITSDLDSDGVRSSPRKRRANSPAVVASKRQRKADSQTSSDEMRSSASSSQGSQRKGSAESPKKGSSSSPRKGAPPSPRKGVSLSPQKLKSSQNLRSAPRRANLRKGRQPTILTNGTSDGEGTRSSSQSSTRSPSKRSAVATRKRPAPDSEEDEINVKRRTRTTRRR